MVLIFVSKFLFIVKYSQLIELILELSVPIRTGFSNQLLVKSSVSESWSYDFFWRR